MWGTSTRRTSDPASSEERVNDVDLASRSTCVSVHAGVATNMETKKQHRHGLKSDHADTGATPSLDIFSTLRD